MDTRARIKIGIVLGLLALVTIVVLQNSSPVVVRVLFWSASVDLLLLLLGLFVVGLITGALLAWVFRPGKKAV
jgi:uncharacterized integral membrane protein